MHLIGSAKYWSQDSAFAGFPTAGDAHLGDGSVLIFWLGTSKSMTERMVRSVLLSSSKG